MKKRNLLMLNWPLVLITTGVLYVAIILSLPFSKVNATLFLFALIGFWSRLPGVGMPHPFFILYNMDFIDVFSIIIAVNLGGPTAALFSISIGLGKKTSQPACKHSC